MREGERGEMEYGADRGVSGSKVLPTASRGGSTPGVKLIALRTEHDIPPFHRVNTEARRFTAECRVPDRTGTLHNRAGCSIHVDPKPDLARRDHRMVALGELPLELSE